MKTLVFGTLQASRGLTRKTRVSDSLYLKGTPSPRFEGQSRKDPKQSPNPTPRSEDVSIINHALAAYQAKLQKNIFFSHFGLK